MDQLFSKATRRVWLLQKGTAGGARDTGLTAVLRTVSPNKSQSAFKCPVRIHVVRHVFIATRLEHC